MNSRHSQKPALYKNEQAPSRACITITQGSTDRIGSWPKNWPNSQSNRSRAHVAIEHEGRRGRHSASDKIIGVASETHSPSPFSCCIFSRPREWNPIERAPRSFIYCPRSDLTGRCSTVPIFPRGINRRIDAPIPRSMSASDFLLQHSPAAAGECSFRYIYARGIPSGTTEATLPCHWPMLIFTVTEVPEFYCVSFSICTLARDSLLQSRHFGANFMTFCCQGFERLSLVGIFKS